MILVKKIYRNDKYIQTAKPNGIFNDYMVLSNNKGK